jgi:hypothetical protein
MGPGRSGRPRCPWRPWRQSSRPWRPPAGDRRGRILDGRNRYAACGEAGVEGQFEAYTGKDPLAEVISLNLKRRHMNESQRAMAGAKVANMKVGDNQREVVTIDTTSQGQAAEMMNVSRLSVNRAAAVRAKGTPELVKAVERGQIPVSQAARLAEAEPAHQVAV